MILGKYRLVCVAALASFLICANGFAIKGATQNKTTRNDPFAVSVAKKSSPMPYAEVKAEQQHTAAVVRAKRAAVAKQKEINSTAITKRAAEEDQVTKNPFTLMAYKPNYVMPIYYSFQPYYRLYKNNLPEHQNLMKGEVKFQVSFKAPIWRNMFGHHISIYGAYSQLSYWQAYENTAFFRESNYEPELFVERMVHKLSFHAWHVELVRAGAVHESNGRGGKMERSWNRLYLDAIFANGNFVIDLKPWYVLHDRQVKKYNHDITDYLGHGRLLLAYKYKGNTFTVMLRNNVESVFRRGTQQLTWSMPIVGRFKFYVQAFHGYGQSLAEYNHRTYAMGAGVALSDYI